mgnify:CR=1 FL=1|tara:strand:- start:206 stop:565 length:360 start_codon:yes stop_codon:yes gene_type:complete
MYGVTPYLIRAYCSWIEDNKLTPYLLVNTRHPDVIFPEVFNANGKMVLNISSSATQNRIISNEAISFKARFRGKPQKIVVPCDAVLSVYAKENGEGMMFDNKKTSPEKKDRKPSLTLLD